MLSVTKVLSLPAIQSSWNAELRTCEKPQVQRAPEGTSEEATIASDDLRETKKAYTGRKETPT